MEHTSKRNGYLDFLKFLFSLGIIGVHSDACGFSFRLISAGYLGVEFFFLVSGYFVARQATKDRKKSGNTQAISNFFIKRICSFFPFYFVAFLYSFVIHNVVNRSATFPDVLYKLYSSLFDILPLQIGNLPSLCVTGVQWYIGSLFVISPVLYALIFKYGSSFTKVFAPIIGVFSLGIVCFQIGTLSVPGTIIYNTFLCGLFIAAGDLFLGAAVYEISETLSKLNFTRIGLWSLHIMRTVLLASAMVLVFANSTGYNDLAFILIIFVYLCLLFGHPVNLPNGLNNICSELGKISMVAFMVHVKTGELVNYCCTGISEPERFVLYYLISIAVAYILYYVTKFLNENTKLKKLFID